MTIFKEISLPILITLLLLSHANASGLSEGRDISITSDNLINDLNSKKNRNSQNRKKHK